MLVIFRIGHNVVRVWDSVEVELLSGRHHIANSMRYLFPIEETASSYGSEYVAVDTEPRVTWHKLTVDVRGSVPKQLKLSDMWS